MVEQKSPAPLGLQVIVRTHDRDRPVRRAVESVLQYPNAGAIVVAHGVPAKDIDVPDDPRVVVIEADRERGFPGVPSNVGVQAATAEFVGLLDSDDLYEEGALEAMHRHLLEDRADAIVAPLKFDDRQPTLLPLTGRTKALDAARDRLLYRTAPHGLFRTSIMQQPGYAFSESVKTGEDMAVTAKFFTSGHRVSYHRHDPAYVMTDESETRVSKTSRPAEDVFRSIQDLLGEPWVRALPAATRESLIIKIARIHVLQYVLAEVHSQTLKPEDFRYLQQVLRRMTATAPKAMDVFSRRESDVLSAVLNGDMADLERQVTAYYESSILRRVLPKKPWKALHRESGLRSTFTGRMILARSK